MYKWRARLSRDGVCRHSGLGLNMHGPGPETRVCLDYPNEKVAAEVPQILCLITAMSSKLFRFNKLNGTLVLVATGRKGAKTVSGEHQRIVSLQLDGRHATVKETLIKFVSKEDGLQAVRNSLQ